MYTAWLMHAYVHASYTHVQIGNKEEVMYFFTNSDQDRNDWIEAFRIGITCLYSTSTIYMYMYKLVFMHAFVACTILLQYR